MESFFITIDRKSVKKNPNAGNTSTIVPGRYATEIVRLTKKSTKVWTAADFDSPSWVLNKKEWFAKQLQDCKFLIEHLLDGVVVMSRDLLRDTIPYKTTAYEIFEVMAMYDILGDTIIKLMTNEISEIEVYKKQTTDTQRLIFMTPIPNYDYKYLPTVVTCDACGKDFVHTSLQSDILDDGTAVTNICLYCGEPECCLLKFEQLTDAELEKLLPKQPKYKVPSIDASKPFADVLHEFRLLKTPARDDYWSLLHSYSRAIQKGNLIWSEAWDIIIKEFEE